MSSIKRRQSSDYNQSVQETEFIPETHSYQEKHFQPTLNQPVPESHSETEYGSTVTPDDILTRNDRSPRSTVIESSDQPGEQDLLREQLNQNLQGNSDTSVHYSTPDVSSGVSSGPGGFTGIETGAAVGSTTATVTVAATSTIASISSVAVTTVGAVIVAATIILPLIVGVPSAIVFEEISVTDTTVFYSIYFEDYEEDMELTVSLHNFFTERTHTVEYSSISVMEKGLTPGMEYKITVYGNMGTVLEERTVKTAKSPLYPTAVTFGSMYVTDTTVICPIEFEGYSPEMDLTVSLHNSSTARSQKVDSNPMKFLEEGLDPETTYYLTVYGPNSVVLNETMVTTLSPDGFVVSNAEFSEDDGLIHLSATMDDPKGVWSDFKAVFYDNAGGTRTELNSVSITSFDSEITMETGVSHDTRVAGTFTVECTEEGKHVTLYEKEMTVMGIPYLNLLTTPTITSGTMTLEFEILDPLGLRTDYEVHLLIDNASSGENYYEDMSIIDGRCEFTGIPSYTYWDMSIKVTCTQSGEFTGVFYDDYSNYDSPSVSLERSNLSLNEVTGGEIELTVPIDLVDKDGVWTDLRVVVGDDYTATTTVKGTTVVVPFSSERSINVPVTDEGVFGQTLDLYICNGSDAPLVTISDITLGPTATITSHVVKPINITRDSVTYNAEFNVEVSDLVDEFNMVVDSNGEWRTDFVTTLTATTSILEPTINAYEVTKLGDGHYMATFQSSYGMGEVENYRTTDVFQANTLSKTLDFLTYYQNENPYTSRDVDGKIHVHNVFYGNRVVYSAKAVCGEEFVNCDIDNSDAQHCVLDCDLDGLDPYSTTIYIYDGSGVLICVTDVFPYPTLVEDSAEYDSSTGWATVRFINHYSEVNMPDLTISEYNRVSNDDGFTLNFYVGDYSGGLYQFHFAVNELSLADYYWETEFTIT